MNKLSSKHLLGLKDCSKEDIELILKTGLHFKEVLSRPIKKIPALQGVTIVNLFFENSTRTRISFELAQKRLSADTVNFSASSSSLNKGESFKDTAQNIEAMKIDAVVMRHPSPGAHNLLTKLIKSVIINAGDGTHEHPTQAILDMMTIQENLGNIKDKKIAIIGDIAHSRVALSNIYGLVKLGAKVTLCGPSYLIPRYIKKLGVAVNSDIDQVIDWADCLNVLRIQKERMGKGLIPSIREYRSLYGITTDRIKKHAKNLLIMHPGPINRGVEIDSSVADGTKSVILDQVLNGVASRMSILYLLLGRNIEDQIK